LLLEAVAKFNGPHLDREAKSDTTKSVETRLRRNVLDKLAYLCDTNKGGATVSAAALQALPSGNVLWLAANEGITESVKTFVKWILDQLKEVNTDNKQFVEERILEQAVTLAGRRISFYYRRLTVAAQCRRDLLATQNGSEGLPA